MLNIFHMLYSFNEWSFKRNDFFFSAILELRDIFKPLTSVRSCIHKPDLPPNAVHFVHTLYLCIPHDSYKKHNFLFCTVLNFWPFQWLQCFLWGTNSLSVLRGLISVFQGLTKNRIEIFCSNYRNKNF